MDIYDELGVRRVINGAGTLTALGGSLMEPETVQAMVQAAESFVYMDELMKKAGEVIANTTGAEAGLVTSGGGASLALAAAACMTGLDLDRVLKLPDTSGMKNEVVIQKLHANKYDRCVRVSGAKLVQVGTDAGTKIEDLELAMSHRTAAILYFAFDPQEGVLPLGEVISVGKRHGVPVVVDAAAELPPAENLRKFVKAGADLVLFSGGKQISGPNDSGFLCGRSDLIEAAWLNAFPNSQGIGRTMKISKEQVVGLVVALKRYVSKNHDAEMAKWTDMAERMAEELNRLPHVNAEVTLGVGRVRPLCIPRTELRIDEREAGVTVLGLVEELKNGDPVVEVLPVKGDTAVQVNPQCLKQGEDDIIVERIREIVSRRSGRNE